MPRRGDERGAPRELREWLPLVAAALPFALVAAFVFQNTDKVRIRFLFWDGRATLGIALLAAAVLGAAGATFLAFVRRRRR